MKTEKDVKDALKKELKTIPCFWYFMPVSLGMGVHGVPDFICLYRGQFVAIETKRPGRRGEEHEGLSALQVQIKKKIIAAGGKYVQVDDQETIDDFMWYIKCCEDAIAEAQNERAD